MDRQRNFEINSKKIKNPKRVNANRQRVRFTMNDIEGWHFSVTIPVIDKEQAIEELKDLDVIKRLISSAIPSYNIEESITYGTGGD